MGQISMTEPKDRNIGIYSDNSLRFLGGGEITLIDMCNYFSSVGMDTFLYDDLQSSDMSRISESSLRQIIKASYMSVPYTKTGSTILYHPMPQKKPFQCTLSILYLYIAFLQRNT